MLDVLVVGGGPTALALARACVDVRLSVAVLAGPDAPWAPNFGVWVDDAAETGLADYLAAQWSDARIVLSDDESLPSGRRYARIARRRLRAAWLDALTAAGVEVCFTRAATVHHADAHTDVVDATGRRFAARVVVDASGHEPALTRRRPASSFQAAFGQLVEVADHPWRDGEAVLMDWRPAGPDVEGPPSFLYVMPHGPRRVFVEETSLIGAPAVSFGVLRERLRIRLARMGVTVDHVEATELCLIPMDGGLPAQHPRMLAFGAAAGFVHPATGYQLIRSLRAAPRLAAALSGRLSVGASVKDAVRAGWRSIWSPAQLAERELYLYGSAVLAELDLNDTVSFFRAFHQIPSHLRRAFLAGDGAIGSIAAAMMATFARCPGRVRRRLLRGASALPARVLRAGAGAGRVQLGAESA